MTYNKEVSTIPIGAMKIPHIAMTTALVNANPEYNVLLVMTYFRMVAIQARSTQMAALAQKPNCAVM